MNLSVCVCVCCGEYNSTLKKGWRDCSFQSASCSHQCQWFSPDPGQCQLVPETAVSSCAQVFTLTFSETAGQSHPFQCTSAMGTLLEHLDPETWPLPFKY